LTWVKKFTEDIEMTHTRESAEAIPQAVPRTYDKYELIKPALQDKQRSAIYDSLPFVANISGVQLDMDTEGIQLC
jgi:hypothetical protein